MEIVEHPVCQVFLVEVVLAIVLVSLFVYEALVLAPVVVLELVKHAFAHSVCDVLEDSQFRVHHSLDAERIDFLCSCHWNLAVCSCVCSFVVFESKIIHVLVSERVLDGAKVRVSAVYCKDFCKDIVAYDFREFRKRVYSKTVFVYVTVDSESVSYTLYCIAIESCFAVVCHVLREETSCLKGIKLVHRSIAVLVITSLVHVCCWQIHFWNHSINRDVGVRVLFSCLCYHVND